MRNTDFGPVYIQSFLEGLAEHYHQLVAEMAMYHAATTFDHEAIGQRFGFMAVLQATAERLSKLDDAVYNSYTDMERAVLNASPQAIIKDIYESAVASFEQPAYVDDLKSLIAREYPRFDTQAMETYLMDGAELAAEWLYDALGYTADEQPAVTTSHDAAPRLG